MPKYRRAVNKVTEELYNQIKPLVKTTRDYRKAKKMFGVSETTLRKIKNTRDFAEYNEKTIKSHEHRAERGKAREEQDGGEIIDLDNEKLDEIERKIVSREEFQEIIDEVKIIIALAFIILLLVVILMRVF